MNPESVLRALKSISPSKKALAAWRFPRSRHGRREHRLELGLGIVGAGYGDRLDPGVRVVPIWAWKSPRVGVGHGMELGVDSTRTGLRPMWDASFGLSGTRASTYVGCGSRPSQVWALAKSRVWASLMRRVSPNREPTRGCPKTCVDRLLHLGVDPILFDPCFNPLIFRGV
ncbi:hypothetical protein L6452_07962 [Arctium lappa]|uniref:Uncharacterized protein n=1 Tax=Arctium lappa TaxID=4217 RepID=A0ACB9DG92_ARCLA|nr:hypothetical protein L6452_07962 [Arctium lappa]